MPTDYYIIVSYMQYYISIRHFIYFLSDVTQKITETAQHN